MKKRKKHAPGSQTAPEYRFPTLRPGMRLEPMQSIAADPMGSYTGVPASPQETPVQDADDL